MADGTKSFPRLPVSQWFKLREQFKTKIPNEISPNYLASTLKMTLVSANTNIFPTLKAIGLVKSDGKTDTDLANQFRNDDLYPIFCESVTKACYPQDLLDAFPDPDSDKAKVQNWFSNHTKVGKDATRKMTAFYLALLSGTPPPLAKQNKQGKKLRDKNSIIEKNKAKSTSKSSAGEISNVGRETHLSNNTEGWPSLNINLQVHLSSDLSVEQIEQIFASMAKHFKKQS